MRSNNRDQFIQQTKKMNEEDLQSHLLKELFFLNSVKQLMLT